LGDTISISAHRKVRPGGARRLRHPRHARPAGPQLAAASGRRALAITAGRAARSTVRRLGRGNGTAAGAAACQRSAGALSAVESVSTSFFGTEHVTIGGREVHLALAENPNGYTKVLRALLGDGQPKHMLLGLNDRASNQQPDVSWIWDVDFESLRGLVPAAVLSGNRATELAVRLKYAGWLADTAAGPVVGETVGGPVAGSTAATDIVVEPDPLRALQLALERTPSGQPVWVVSTDLVLRRLRSWLCRQGYAGALRER
jgi:MurT ligase C-terminal